MSKLIEDKPYDHEFYWVGAPEALAYNPSPVMELLIENRYKLDILGGVHDKNADYSYDDWALVKLKDKYYLLSTSGCSCPSPNETWTVQIGPATLKQIRKFVSKGNYTGYSLPRDQEEDFMALLDKAEGK